MAFVTAAVTCTGGRPKAVRWLGGVLQGRNAAEMSGDIIPSQLRLALHKKEAKKKRLASI